jgi:IclR family transcriptional regulator, pca regulon regulatory protein
MSFGPTPTVASPTSTATEADPTSRGSAASPSGRQAPALPERDFVKSLDRGLAVIRALSVPPPGLTLAEVARATGLARPAARRFLLTLEQIGYARSEERRFSLTPRVLELGYSFLSGLTLPELAQPHLRELAMQVRESCSVSVLDGTEIVYVARESTRRIMTVAIAVGTRFPAYATSMGRVLLAGLDDADLERTLGEHELRALTPSTVTRPDALRAEIARVRQQGWALVDQELENGLRSIAVPLRNRNGRVSAAVNLSTHASGRTLKQVRTELLKPLRETASQIERDLWISEAPRSDPRHHVRL